MQTHANNQPTNDTKAPHTLDAVSLGPTGNRQGGYYFLNLTTGKHITRNHFTPYPTNKLVSHRIKRMGLRQGHKAQVKFL